MAAAEIVGILQQWRPETNLVWIANGLLLSYLLLAPRRDWPAYLATGFLALSIRTLLMPGKGGEFLLYNVLDIVEVATGALLLRWRSPKPPRFTQGAYILRFFGFAVLAGPVLSGALYALALRFWHFPASQHPFQSWTIADSLGVAIGTPAFVAVFRTRFRDSVNWRRNWFYPAILMAVTYAAFAQSRMPMFELIFPLLVLVLLRLRLGYASLSLLCVAAIAEWLTVHGSGPFAAAARANPTLPSLLIQVTVASAMFMIYAVSMVQESQLATERRLRKIAALHTLVTENSHDILILTDFEGHRKYVSAAIEWLGGWTREDLMRHGNLELIHPEDVARMASVVQELHSGAEEALVECRARKRNGDYIWVEDNLRVYRDPDTGLRSRILNSMRDISERKRAEQKLQEAYSAVEALAVTDGLTGLANRRHFDQYLLTEWRRSERDHAPISLLMIDADFFKLYNDDCGHPRGDNCLKQIAEAIQDVVSRQGDLIARFGGDEFAVILPNTGNEGAMQVARDICESMSNRKLPHSGNPCGIVTVSAGCATMAPSFGQHVVKLIELADQALYNAKKSGRNRVCNADAMESESPVRAAVHLEEGRGLLPK
jgi:diguanylate cyclase (GGDEF)-like protein/PAS domain S-box-containing protein